MAKEKIVVIDDSQIVRKLAELALEEEGYKVYTAEDGEEGLRICEEVRPAVILVDFIMPRISGYQFCEAARDNELLKDIPIILITGKGEDVGKKFAEKFGVGDYFIKPFKSEVLVEKVNAIIYAQKEQAGEEITLEEPKAAVFESHEIVTPQVYEEQPSFYGTPTVAAEPASVVEPVYSTSDLGLPESAPEEFKFSAEELTMVSAETPLQVEEPVSQHFEPVAQVEEPLAQHIEPVVEYEEPVVKQIEPVVEYEEPFVQPVEPATEREEPVVKFEETAAMADFAYPPTNEMLVEPEPVFSGAGKEAVLEYPSTAGFEPAAGFTAAGAYESVAEKTFETQPAPAAAESVEKLFRRYFNEELPYLIEKNIEDVLRRHGIIKDTSILFSGDLGSVCGFEAMKFVDAQKLTGKFSAFSSAGSAEIYFDKGEVVFALSSRQGSTLTSKRVAIIKKGYESEAEGPAQAAIVDAILTVTDFRDGSFYFEKMPPPRALLDLGMRSNVVSLVLQGWRGKTDVMESGREFNESDVPVRAISDGAARNVGMNSQEIDVFLSVDGISSVADIGKSGNLSVSDVSGILGRLGKAGIVTPKGIL